LLAKFEDLDEKLNGGSEEGWEWGVKYTAPSKI
jgi:hypothetical protein